MDSVLVGLISLDGELGAEELGSQSEMTAVASATTKRVQHQRRWKLKCTSLPLSSYSIVYCEQHQVL